MFGEKKLVLHYVVFTTKSLTKINLSKIDGTGEDRKPRDIQFFHLYACNKRDLEMITY